MKAWCLGVAIMVFGGAGIVRAADATNAAPAQEPAVRSNPMLSFLAPADQDRYVIARAKALADNPDIKAEGENLLTQGSAFNNAGTPADKQAFMLKMVEHRQKLRQAMLKEDATLGPVFEQIDRHLSELRRQKAQESGSPAGVPATTAGTTGGN